MYCVILVHIYIYIYIYFFFFITILQGDLTSTFPRQVTKPELPKKPTTWDKQDSTDGGIPYSEPTTPLPTSPKPTPRKRSTAHSESSKNEVVLEFRPEAKPVPSTKPRPTPPRAKPRSSTINQSTIIKQPEPEVLTPVEKPSPSPELLHSDVSKIELSEVSDILEENEDGPEDKLSDDVVCVLDESTNHEQQKFVDINSSIPSSPEGKARGTESEKHTEENTSKSVSVSEDSLDDNTMNSNFASTFNKVDHGLEQTRTDHETLKEAHSSTSSQMKVEGDFTMTGNADICQEAQLVDANITSMPTPDSICTNSLFVDVDESESANLQDDQTHDYELPADWNEPESFSASLNTGYAPLGMPSTPIQQNVNPTYDVPQPVYNVPRPVTPGSREHSNKPAWMTVDETPLLPHLQQVLTRSQSLDSMSCASVTQVANYLAKKDFRERTSLPGCVRFITDHHLNKHMDVLDKSIEVSVFRYTVTLMHAWLPCISAFIWELTSLRIKKEIILYFLDSFKWLT